MANEISVRTTYTFLSEDGTMYQRDHTYDSDSASTASFPKRIMFVADTNGLNALDFSTINSYRVQLTGPSMLMLVNRDERVDMIVQLSTSNLTEKRILGPGERIFLDVTDGSEPLIGGGGAFTYASESLVAVSVSTQFQSAKGELVCILKSAS